MAVTASAPTFKLRVTAPSPVPTSKLRGSSSSIRPHFSMSSLGLSKLSTQSLAMFRHGKRLLKQSSSTSNARLPVLVALLLLVMEALVLFGNRVEKSSSMSEILNQKWKSFDYVVRLDPTVEFRNGTDFIWQMPDSPKAVIFLAHGCNGRAANFWDKTPKCLNCVGLLKERLIVMHAMARKFAILAISSAGRCWSLGDERQIVKDIIESWIVKQNLEKLPLFALGASLGGYFVLVLATYMSFRGIILMIAEGVLGHMEITKDYPPIIFVHMPKDENKSQMIEKYLIILKEMKYIVYSNKNFR